jgi:uncharacterized protein (DUF433 family)
LISPALAYPHIEKIEGQPASLARIKRVRVAQIVMDYLAHGWSTDEICRQHPYMTLAEAHSAMAYYFDNQTEIDAEIQTELASSDAHHRQSPAPAVIAQLRARGTF